ncbi:MAG: hypothetical protein AAGJ85_04180 [Pseudomonadota bacterium]
MIWALLGVIIFSTCEVGGMMRFSVCGHTGNFFSAHRMNISRRCAHTKGHAEHERKPKPGGAYDGYNFHSLEDYPISLSKSLNLCIYLMRLSVMTSLDHNVVTFNTFPNISLGISGDEIIGVQCHYIEFNSGF